MAIKIALIKNLDEVVFKQPINFTVKGVDIQSTLNDGTVVKVFPGVEDVNTVVSATKDGVTVECELKETWLQNWLTTKENAPKPRND